MRRAEPNVKLLCRNNQYNQCDLTGTPWYSSPGGQDAVIPSTTPWFAKTFWDVLASGPDGYMDMDPTTQLLWVLSCNEVWSSAVQINRIFASDVTYMRSKPKSQLFKLSIDVMST